MAYIKLKNVNLEYPIYNSKTRSLKTAVFKSVGGSIAEHDKNFSVKALNNINLSLKEGDNLAILGHNGAGKTTLLRVISDIYKPTSGEIDIDGSLSSLTNIQLGMEPEASGYENIIMRGIFMGMSFSEIKSKADEIIEFSELGSYIELPMRTYSTGMALRLAFAISTCVTPEILVLDEMIGAGDKNFIQKARKRTKQLMEEAKILVLSSHSYEILKEFCNKAILMREGSIIEEGSVEQVINYHEKLKSKTN